MASTCKRLISRSSPSIKSAFRSNGPKSPFTRSAATPSSTTSPLPSQCTSPLRRFSLSRCPSELGCAQSLLPLHTAVAAARMTSCLSTTSRNCRALSQGESNMKRDVVEDVAIIGGLVAVQFVYAGNAVLLYYLMSLGLRPFTIIIFFTLATSIILSPFAFYFERSQWPNQLTLKFIIQLVLISFGGITLFQSLFLEGIKLASPALATAMPNLAPGLIFIIAWTLRLEKVTLSCLYSKVKIAGTILCVSGAITMSVIQSTVLPEDAMAPTAVDGNIFEKNQIIGCMYLMTAVLVLSSNIILQATTLGDFPAPISLCAVTSFIGVIITSLVQLLQNHDFLWGHSLVSALDLLGFSLLGGAMTGACVSFSGWAMKKRGPVLVSMFCPIGTVITVLLSFISLGKTISLGSLAGMFLMFIGLYFVLWAKGKEVYSVEDDFEGEFDPEKPLLS